MYNETAIYNGDGVPPTGNVIFEAKMLLKDLKEVAKEEDVSLDVVLRAYECKTREYSARMVYQCADSIQRVANNITDEA